MGRAPCCDKANVKKGPWSPEEDTKLKDYIEKYGTGGNWIALPQKVGLKRCGKSCRLRWLNYLRPNIKHGEFSDDEDRIICTLYATIGSRWSIIAAQLPGRTDNDIKNYWNTKLKKKLMGIMLPSPNQKSKLQNPNYPLQAHPSQIPSLPSIPPVNYKDYPPFFNPTTKSLLGLEHPQILPNQMNNNIFTNYNFSPCWETSFSLVPSSQDQGLFGPTQGYNGNFPQVKERILMFGGDQIQASCSSSDGSVSHGREIKQEEMGIYMPNVGFEENPKFVIDYGKVGETLVNTNGGYFGNNGGLANNNGLDEYGSLEEVKQLISSGANDDHLYFNVACDENKTQDQRAMYYY